MLNEVEQNTSNAGKQSEKPIVAPDRKKQILLEAVEIIATEGYGKLSMRALARASGITLGALQYHFRTWEEMLRALSAFIIKGYEESWVDTISKDSTPSLQGFMRILLKDAPGLAFQSEKLYPQLWAMAQVEPIMKELQSDIFDQYVDGVEKLLANLHSQAPRAEAVAIVSMIEGSMLFRGEPYNWKVDADEVYDAIIGFIDAKYGKQKTN